MNSLQKNTKNLKVNLMQFLLVGGGLLALGIYLTFRLQKNSSELKDVIPILWGGSLGIFLLMFFATVKSTRKNATHFQQLQEFALVLGEELPEKNDRRDTAIIHSAFVGRGTCQRHADDALSIQAAAGMVQTNPGRNPLAHFRN